MRWSHFSSRTDSSSESSRLRVQSSPACLYRPFDIGVFAALFIWAWLLAVFWNRIGGDPAIYFNFSKHFFSRPFSYFDGGPVQWGATGPLTVVVYALAFGNWHLLNLIACILIVFTLHLLGRLGKLHVLQTTLLLLCFPALTFSSLNKFESLVWFPMLISFMLSGRNSLRRCLLAGLLPLVRPELLLISLYQGFFATYRRKILIVVPLIVFWSYMFATTGTAIPTSIGERLFRYLPDAAPAQGNLVGIRRGAENSPSTLAPFPSFFRELDPWDNLSLRLLTALHLLVLGFVIWRKFGSNIVIWLSRFLPLMALFALAHASRTAYLAVPEGLTLAFCVKHGARIEWPTDLTFGELKSRRMVRHRFVVSSLVGVVVLSSSAMAIFDRWYPQEKGHPVVPFEALRVKQSEILPYQKTMGYDLAEVLIEHVPFGDKVLIYEIGMQASSPREMISLDGIVASEFRPLSSSVISERIRSAGWFVSSRGCDRDAVRGTLIGVICEHKGAWKVGDWVEDSEDSLRVVAVNEFFDQGALWDSLWQRGVP